MLSNWWEKEDSYTQAAVMIERRHMQAGDVVNGRYRIDKAIGGGAYGTVYLVEDLSHPESNLALKQIEEQGFSPEERKEAVELYMREAKILMDLHHEGLTAIIDAFSEVDNTGAGGCHYLVMEYIEGETLEEIQKRNKCPFKPAEIIPWALDLARIMEYLHSSKPDPIIFRDLKPSNIMLDTKGRIKLIDFGIARYFVPGKLKDTYALGTPGYSPPEQYGSGQSDVRSDIFSFGVTLYRLLSDADPEQFNFKFPPLSTIVPKVPDWLESIIMRCIAINPGDRLQSSSELVLLLEKGKVDMQGISPPPAAVPSRSIYSMLIDPITIPEKFFVCLGAIALSVGIVKFFIYLMQVYSGGGCFLSSIGIYLIALLCSHMGKSVGLKMHVLVCFGILSFIAFLSALLIPGFLRARAQGQLTACKSNLVDLGIATQKYYEDKKQYPDGLEQLTPQYLKNIPFCPIGNKKDYSYIKSREPAIYTLYCGGKNHSFIYSRTNYPQYDSIQGLIESP